MLFTITINYIVRLYIYNANIDGRALWCVIDRICHASSSHTHTLWVNNEMHRASLSLFHEICKSFAINCSAGQAMWPMYFGHISSINRSLNQFVWKQFFFCFFIPNTQTKRPKSDAFSILYCIHTDNMEFLASACCKDGLVKVEA